jgi:capsular polysaccharide biosynthesis protein
MRTNGDTRALPSEDAYVLPVQDLLSFLRRRLWAIVLVSVLFCGVAVGVSLTLPPMYEASVKILVGQERGITQTPDDVAGLQDLAETMAEAINSRSVAETVIEQLDLQITAHTFLEERLSVAPITNTQFVQVRYRDPDPERAREVVNTVGTVFSERISKVSPKTNSITATVWDRAVTPEQPVTPNPVRNGLIGLIMGVILGTGLAFLLEYLDDRWHSPEEAEQITGIPTFGVVPSFNAAEGSAYAILEGEREGKGQDS